MGANLRKNPEIIILFCYFWELKQLTLHNIGTMKKSTASLSSPVATLGHIRGRGPRSGRGREERATAGKVMQLIF